MINQIITIKYNQIPVLYN